MKRIGITQRVEVEPEYGERRDCLDQSWASLFKVLDFDLIPIPNNHEDISNWAMRMKLNGIVLSGGNDLTHLPNVTKPAPERDACERNLLSWAANLDIPVLGVCRGMQMMNYFLGGSIKSVHGHVACKHDVKPCTKNNLFLNYVAVNSFHGWGIDASNLSPCLMPQLIAEDGSVEAFQHESKPWLGIMWHPERANGQNFILDCNLLRALFSDQHKG